MASVIDRDTLHCSCCGLRARKTEWSCGCVTVEYEESVRACSDCDDFRGQRETCGKPGWPGHD